VQKFLLGHDSYLVLPDEVAAEEHRNREHVYRASDVEALEAAAVDQALRIKELEAGAGLSLQQAKEMQALRDRITKLERALQTLAACNLHEGNCASLEIATKRIRRLAAEALSTAI
jgi:hypothetical protein